ncbi:MAG: VWA domain-containing protein [Myxococcota bacterium]
MHRIRARRLLRRLFRQRGLSYAAALGCAALATAGVVLAHGPGPHGHRMPPLTRGTPPPVTGPTHVQFTSGPLTITGALSQGAVLVGDGMPVLFEVTVKGEDGVEGPPPPVAMALVIDTSGSMSGAKIAQAKTALQQTVNRMRDTDSLSIVIYNSGAHIAVPMGPIAGRRVLIRNEIARIEAGGGTDIPSGLRLGQQTLATATRGQVRRMVLLSDGIDGSNLGADGVASLVAGYAQRGVTTAALGLGVDYDERYLTSVADGGRGAYAFLATGNELDGFLRAELDAAGSTIAEDVAVELNLPGNLRPVRAHGGILDGHRLILGSVSSGSQRRVTVELQSFTVAPTELPLALGVHYHRPGQAREHDGSPAITLDAVHSVAQVEDSRVDDVYARSQAILLEARQHAAIQLWEEGDNQAAAELARGNAVALRELQALDATPEIANQLSEVEQEANRFETTSARSRTGRIYRLSSNARRRSRVRSGSWQ